MDLGLFNDKLSLVFDWYRQTTNDMLMPNVRIPSNSGYPTIAYRNVGSMRNTGWELNINTDHLLQAGKFYVDVNVTLGNNKNEILEMDETILETLNTDFTYANREVLQRVQLHNPFGAIYGFRSKGVYQYQYDTFAKMSHEEQAAFLAEGKTAPVALDANGQVIYDEKGMPIRMMYAYSNGSTAKN